MKKQLFKVAGFVLMTIIIVIGALSFNRVYQANEIQTTKDKHATPHLNIALVNEDKGTQINGNTVNLGQNYVTQAEKAKGNSWYVVSQGIGAAGVRDGDYQLMIEIPTNFSSKMLDVNNPNPENATVTYTVSDASNVNVRMTAERIGKQAITDLNQQLVNVYFASVLDNLYTAQNNVAALVNNDGNNLATYTSRVVGPVKEAQATYPMLQAGMSSTSATNMTLQNAFDRLSVNANSVYQSGQTSDQKLTTLIQDHAAGVITDAQFYASIDNMGPNVLGDEINKAMQSLLSTSTSLQVNVGNPVADQTNTDMSAGLKNKLGAFSDALSSSATNRDNSFAQTATLITSMRTLQNNFASQFAREVVGKADTSKLTVGQMLAYAEKNSTDMPAGTQTTTNNDIKVLIDQMNANNIAKRDTLQSQIANMGLASADTYVPGWFDFKKPGVLTDISSASESDGVTDQALKNLRSDIDKVAASVDQYNKTSDSTLKMTMQENFDQPEDSEAYKNRQAFLDAWAAVKQEKADNQTNGTKNTAARDQFLMLVAQLDGSYQTLTTEVNNFSNPAINDQKLPTQAAKIYDMNLSAYIDKVGSQLVLKSMGIDSEPLTTTKPKTNFTADDLYKAVTTNTDTKQLATLYDQLNGVTNRVSSDASSLDAQVRAQSTQLKALQTQFSGVVDAKNLAKTNQDTFDKQLDATSQQVASYLKDSENLKQTSENQVKTAETTTAAMEAFSKQIEDATKGGATLDNNASGLNGQMSSTQSTNATFMSQFKNVLGNSHQNGVKNEKLISFLSNPVSSNLSVGSADAQATLNPFGWILILFTTSLFATFAIQAIAGVKTLVKSVVADATNVGQNIMQIILNVIVHLLIGLGIGFVVAPQISDQKIDQPTLVLVVLMLTIIFGLINSYLIRQFRTLGLGVAVIFLVAYVFTALSGQNAATINAVWQVVAELNPLSLGGRAIVAVVSHLAVGSMLIKLGLVIVGAVLINLLVFNQTWQEVRTKVAAWRSLRRKTDEN
jgi:type VII secretion EsaA-like protein